MSYSVVVYSHSDYSDILKILFGQNKKYFSNSKKYLLINKTIDEIPEDYDVILYDETLYYTNRLYQSLQKIKDDVILFFHEDMFLYDFPKYKYLEKYCDYIREFVIDSVKLISAGDEYHYSTFDNTLIYNEFAKFSIQPTLIRKEYLIKLLENNQNLSIWDFEKTVSRNGNDYMCKIGIESKRGIYHYNSIIYPYVATAINKGKWNYSEYKEELNKLFIEYDIDLNIRGIL